MKKLLAISAMALVVGSAFGQGQVNFVNIDKGVTPNILAIITDKSDGHALAGTEARAALLGGPAGSTAYSIVNGAITMGNLTMLANPNDTTSTYLSFRTGAAAGYVAAAPRILNNVGYNSQAMLQMVVWTGNATDWTSALNAAIADGSTKVGVSAPWTVTTTLNATDPGLAHNIGLSSFSIAPVPEPSTMALAGLGAAALLIFRRRK